MNIWEELSGSTAIAKVKDMRNLDPYVDEGVSLAISNWLQGNWLNMNLKTRCIKSWFFSLRATSATSLYFPQQRWSPPLLCLSALLKTWYGWDSGRGPGWCSLWMRPRRMPRYWKVWLQAKCYNGLQKSPSGSEWSLDWRLHKRQWLSRSTQNSPEACSAM